MQVPIINTGGEASDQGAVIAHVLLSPNEALTRPGVNADWMDVLIGSAFSYIAAASNRGFRSVAPVAELPGRGGVPAGRRMPRDIARHSERLSRMIIALHFLNLVQS